MNLTTHWDSELQRRYALNEVDQRCYPGSSKLQPSVGEFDTLRALRTSRQALKPLSLYVHLPFCASLCYHCHRHKIALNDPQALDDYLHSLAQEFALVSSHLDPRQQVERLHIGGGTPTLLNHQQLIQLGSSLRQHFSLVENSADYSIEIDPRRTDWPTMGLLRELGFNRIQLQVHDLADAVQNAINRRPSFKETRGLVEAARALAFKNIGIELIYGLPEQSAASFITTLKEMISLQPDRLSLKAFRYQPQRFSDHQRFDPSHLASTHELLQLREQSLNVLLQAGYLHLGLEHFVLAYDDLLMAQDNGNLHFDRNGYSNHNPCDLLGFGLGAISQIGGVLSRNSHDLEHYQQQLKVQRLPRTQGFVSSSDDQLRAFIIEQLQCQQRLDFKQLEQRFNIRFSEYFAPIMAALEQMAEEKILYLSAEELRISAVGRHLIQPLCQLFDKH